MGRELVTRSNFWTGARADLDLNHFENGDVANDDNGDWLKATGRGLGADVLSAITVPPSNLLDVQEEGGNVVVDAKVLNFVGPDVTVTDGGSGTAIVTVALVASGIDHGGLAGLADDDHALYALADKTRPAVWVAAADLAARSVGDLGTRDHDLLAGLGDDDHTQYALLAGRTGGQTQVGGTDPGDGLILRATASVTPGNVTIENEPGVAVATFDSSGDMTMTASGDILPGAFGAGVLGTNLLNWQNVQATFFIARGVAGDANPRMQLGVVNLRFGPGGGSALDTDIGRIGINQLSTAGSLTVGATSAPTVTLDVRGAIRSAGTSSTSFLNLADGNAVAAGVAGEVRFRSNAGVFEVSENGAAFATIGGGVSGSGVANQVAVFDGATSIAGSAALTFASNTLTVTAAAAAADVAMLIENTDGTANSAAVLRLAASGAALGDAYVRYSDDTFTYSAGLDGGTNAFTIAESSDLGSNLAITVAFSTQTVTIVQELRVGTALDAIAQGDASFGLTGASSTLFYDQSGASVRLDNTTGAQAIIWRANGITVVNEQGSSSNDFRAEGLNAPGLLNVDAGVSRLGVSNMDTIQVPQGLLSVLEETNDTDLLVLATDGLSGGVDDIENRFRQGSVETTDATITTINSISILSTQTIMITVKIVARRTAGGGSADDGATYWIKASYTRKAGAPVLLGAIERVVPDAEDVAAWDVTFTVVVNDILIQVTGVAATTIKWHSHLEYQHLST